jgi:hypothetical protein
MAINTDIYGSIDEAAAYFTGRLHSDAWDEALSADQTKALLSARRLIDNLDYKGEKHAVYIFHQQTPPPWRNPTNGTFDRQKWEQYHEQERTANASQSLEFPRGADTDVPEAIRVAEYELAYSLLDGVDPQMELENLSVTAQGYAEVRTHYERNMVPIEHLINLIPNPLAWSLLKPFLRDDQAVRMSRVS